MLTRSSTRIRALFSGFGTALLGMIACGGPIESEEPKVSLAEMPVPVPVIVDSLTDPDRPDASAEATAEPDTVLLTATPLPMEAGAEPPEAPKTQSETTETKAEATEPPEPGKNPEAETKPKPKSKPTGEPKAEPKTKPTPNAERTDAGREPSEAEPEENSKTKTEPKTKPKP